MTDHKTHEFITRIEWDEDADADARGEAPCFDEIVTGPVDMVHIERMSDGHYWMAIYKGDKRQVVIFHTQDDSMMDARTRKEHVGAAKPPEPA
jgi:hypothetical protein